MFEPALIYSNKWKLFQWDDQQTSASEGLAPISWVLAPFHCVFRIVSHSCSASPKLHAASRCSDIPKKKLQCNCLLLLLLLLPKNSSTWPWVLALVLQTSCEHLDVRSEKPPHQCNLVKTVVWVMIANVCQNRNPSVLCSWRCPTHRMLIVFPMCFTILWVRGFFFLSEWIRGCTTACRTRSLWLVNRDIRCRRCNARFSFCSCLHESKKWDCWSAIAKFKRWESQNMCAKKETIRKVGKSEWNGRQRPSACRQCQLWQKTTHDADDNKFQDTKIVTTKNFATWKTTTKCDRNSARAALWKCCTPNGWLEILLDPTLGKIVTHRSDPILRFFEFSQLSTMWMCFKNNSDCDIVWCFFPPCGWQWLTIVNKSLDEVHAFLSASSNICSASQQKERTSRLFWSKQCENFPFLQLHMNDSPCSWFSHFSINFMTLFSRGCVLLLDCRKYSKCSVMLLQISLELFESLNGSQKWSCFMDLMDYVPNSISARLGSLSDSHSFGGTYPGFSCIPLPNANYRQFRKQRHICFSFVEMLSPCPANFTPMSEHNNQFPVFWHSFEFLTVLLHQASPLLCIQQNCLQLKNR